MHIASGTPVPRAAKPTRCHAGTPLLLALGACAAGCQPRAPGVQLDEPELQTFVRLMTPVRIEIQRYLTRPYDFGGTGGADGIEVILAALDTFGDPVKCVGTFHFELYTMRMASGDKLGTQVAFWPVTINSEESLAQYWDRPSPYHRFPLQLREGRLAPGRYILVARLVTPTGEKLTDTYEFSYGQP